jgi:hypothetical protein
LSIRRGGCVGLRTAWSVRASMHTVLQWPASRPSPNCFSTNATCACPGTPGWVDCNWIAHCSGVLPTYVTSMLQPTHHDTGHVSMRRTSTMAREWRSRMRDIRGPDVEDTLSMAGSEDESEEYEDDEETAWTEVSMELTEDA